jgi:hypothetical protein
MSIGGTENGSVIGARDGLSRLGSFWSSFSCSEEPVLE